MGKEKRPTFNPDHHSKVAHEKFDQVFKYEGISPKHFGYFVSKGKSTRSESKQLPMGKKSAGVVRALESGKVMPLIMQPEKIPCK